MIGWLREWGKVHSVSLLQVLPQSLWSQTRLRGARVLTVSPDAPAGPNQRLRIQRRALAWLNASPEQEIPMLITTLAQDFIADWARFVAGDSRIMLPAFAFKAVPLTPPSDEPPLSLEQRYQRFRAAASPTASKLACFLAAAPLTLPIMRLVQAALVPESGQTHLAEFLLSGLIRRVTLDAEVCHADEIDYDFITDELRPRLLKAGQVTDSAKVLELVSKYLSEHRDMPNLFQAALHAPETLDSIAASEETRPFAIITAQVLQSWGGKYERLADRIMGMQEIYQDGGDISGNNILSDDSNIGDVIRIVESKQAVRLRGSTLQFNWLHLSDLHWGKENAGDSWVWDDFKPHFFDDLQMLHKESGPWDAIFFTGDLTNRGTAKEFARLDILINELMEKNRKFWLKACVDCCARKS